MKFAEVLMIETRVVEEARVRADVNSAHIRALKARLREKKNCCQERIPFVSGEGSFSNHGGERREWNKEQSSDEKIQGHMTGRTARIIISTTLFVEESPKAVEIPAAHDEVSSVVVLDVVSIAHYSPS